MATGHAEQSGSNNAELKQAIEVDFNKLIGESMDMFETSCVPDAIGPERFEQIKRLFKGCINRARGRILRQL